MTFISLVGNGDYCLLPSKIGQKHTLKRSVTSL